MSEIVATIAQLYIYPVKSMAGISVQEAHVGLDGILGDRLYSFVREDQAGNDGFPWMTARQSARMLLYRPNFNEAPVPAQPEPPVSVRTPEGSPFDVNDPALREELASQTAQRLFLLKSSRGFHDCQHISVLSLATVRSLATEADCVIDPRQFRANLYVEPVSGQPFEEEAWPGGLLQIGSQALIGVTKRDGRCMIINLDPESGTQDPRVLKTVAQRHGGQVGVYANVIRRGAVRVGDAVRLITAPVAG
jgi:uncharacterized protein YcbX